MWTTGRLIIAYIAVRLGVVLRTSGRATIAIEAIIDTVSNTGKNRQLESC